MLDRIAMVAFVLLWSGTGAAMADDPADSRVLRRAGEAVAIDGVWAQEGRFGVNRLTFAQDGTFERLLLRDGQPQERQTGRFEVPAGDALVLAYDDQPAVRYKALLEGANNLTLVTPEGGAVTYHRLPVAAPPTIANRDIAAEDTRALRPNLAALQPSASGHIGFSRYEAVGEMPVRRLYGKTGDGAGEAKFIHPGGIWETAEPEWALGGRALVFSSNFEMPRSALCTDCFIADLKTGQVRRLTGNVMPPSAVGEKSAALVCTITGKVQLPESPQSLAWVSFQGGGGKVFRFEGKGSIRVTGLPPNQTIWVKLFINRHIGRLRIVKTPPADKALEVELSMNGGNLYATRPSLSPDGKHLLVFWQHASWEVLPDQAKPPLLVGPDGEFVPATPGPVLRKPHQKGQDTVALVDVERGTPPVASWDPTKMQGNLARDARFAPDGAEFVVAVGQTLMESLTACTAASFRAGAPQVRVIVPGRLLPGQGYVGNRQAAWSPDGRQLTFVQYVSDLNGNIAGNLMIVNRDGSGLRQITRLAPNQSPAQPCFSPDGRRIAFQLVTARQPRLALLDVIAGHVQSDIWTIGVDGAAPKQLTRDGRSAEPAWGP